MISIETKKEIVAGVLGRRIQEIKALPPNKLPAEYLVKRPSVHRLNSRIGPGLTIQGHHLTEDIFIGDFVEEDRFQKLLQIVYDAGERLMKINERDREKAKKFPVGEVETFWI